MIVGELRGIEVDKHGNTVMVRHDGTNIQIKYIAGPWVTPAQARVLMNALRAAIAACEKRRAA